MTSKLKCPFCKGELKQTSLYMDGNSRFTHKYVGALEGGKDRCPLDGETLHYRGWQALIQSQQQLKMLEPIVASLQGRADINAEEARDSNELVAQWYEKYEQSQKDLDTARKALEYVKDAGLFVFAKIEAEKALEQIEHKE